MSWQHLIDGNPELAAYGAARFEGRVAYLGTVGTDGAPRVHPVSPQLRQNRLFVFMYPTSPKAHDLLRGSRYALHCGVEGNDGGGGEFYVRGTAQQVMDAAAWEMVRPNHADEFNVKYILFELLVDQAFSMVYVGDDSVKNRWRKSE